MKRTFLRAMAYIGLYSEIFSASCRWLVSAPCGWRAPYKTFMTRALKASGYIPPTQEEIDAVNAQHRVNSEYALLTFHGKQPETIQACLKFDPALFEKLYRNRRFHPYHQEVGAEVPAIPPFCKGDL